MIASIIFPRNETVAVGSSLAAIVTLAEGTTVEALAPLTQVEHGLTAAPQYDAFLLSRKVGMWALTAAGTVRAFAVPETARAKRASSDVSDDVAVAQGLQQLAATVTQQLSDPKASIGRSEQFPENLATDISQDEFETWVRLLLVSLKYAHLLHGGLLVPIVHHALKLPIQRRSSCGSWFIHFTAAAERNAFRRVWG